MPPTKEFVAASIASGMREKEALMDVAGHAITTVNRIGYSVSEIHGVQSFANNRALLDAAEAGLTILRSELREVRRICKLIDHRRDRRENGTYLP